MIKTNFSKIGDPKDDGDHLKFSKLNINGFTDDGFNLEAAAILPPLVPWLPASMKLLNPVFYIGSESGKYVQLKVPDMDIKLNEPFSLDMEVRIQFVDNPGLRDYIKHAMNDIEKPNLIISSDLVVEILGTVWYRGLPVQKVVDLNKKAGPVKTSNYNGTIPEALVTSNPNELFREKYPETKRIILGSNLPDIVWENFDLKMTDDGVNISFLFELENPTVATLDIPEIKLGLGVNLVDFVRISVSPIVLNHGINEMKLDIGIKFVQIDDSTGKSLGDLINGEYLTINGPISLKGASFAEKVSTDFKLELSIFNPSEAYSSPNNPKTDEILEKSEISVHLDGSEIKIPVSLMLPRFLPLPSHIEIPASISFGIFGKSEKAMHVTINPVVIDTTNEFINVKTGIKIVPVNSEEASDSLAASINPLLAINPSNSSIGIGDIKFSVGEHVLGWSESLMKFEKITVPLTAICVKCLLSESSEDQPVKIPLPKDLSVTQLNEVSGFSISAIVPMSDSLRLAVDLGYFGINVNLQGKDFILFDLPSGIRIPSDRSHVDLNSRLILSHEPSLANNFQNMLNSVRYGDRSSILSITGLRLGDSEQNSVQTFSKIVMDLDSKTFYGTKFPQFGSDSEVPKPLISLNHADLAIKSANIVQISAGASLYELPLGLSIGSIFFRTSLDGEELLSLGLSPISVSPEKLSFSLGASLGLTSGNPALSEKVGVLANKILNSEYLDDLKISVTGFIISPPGVSSGPAIIDQFKNLSITFDPLQNSDGYSSGCLIDTSVLKDTFELSALGIKSNELEFKTLPKAVLSLSADVDYDNQLPIQLVAPYIKAEIAVQDVPLVEQTYKGFNLSQGPGHMSASADLYFQQDDDSIQDLVAKVVLEIEKNKCIETKISVRGFYFGVSETDRNDLFSKVDIDFTKVLGELKLPTLDFPDFSQSSNSSLSDNGDFEFLKASFQALPGKKVALDASVGIKVSTAISSNIGTFQSTFLVNKYPLMKVAIHDFHTDLKSNTLEIDIGADILFQENERTPAEVASIVNTLAKNQSVGSALKINEFRIGYSEDDKINTFSKIQLPVPADAMLQRFNEKKSDNSVFSPIDLKLKAEKLEVSFEPGNVILANAAASARLPFNVSISLPYLDVNLGVDNTLAGRTVFQKIYISSSEISGDMRLIFQDSEELENKLGELSEAILNGERVDQKAGVHGIIFGFSENDLIMAFSQMDLEIPVDSLISKTSSEKSKIMDAMADAYIDEMKIKNVYVGTESGKLIKSSVEVEFNSNLNVTINGLGHLAGHIAIDSQPIMETVFSGLHLNPGSNNLIFNANLHFVPSRDSQVQVATLIDDIFYKNNSDLSQIVCGTGLEIGYNSEDYIKALRKVKIGIQASKLLKPPDMKGSGSFKPQGLLDNLEIKRNDVDLSQPGAVKIGLDFSILNLTIPLAAKIGYMGLSTQLEGADLATVGVHNFLFSHNDGIVGVSCDVQIDIPGGNDIKVIIAQTAKNIMENGLPNVSVSTKLYNIGVGSSQNDLINTFSLIDAVVNPLSYLPADSPSVPTKSNASLIVDIIYADVLDSRRLSAEVHGRLIDFAPCSLNIPFFAVSSHMDGEELLEVSVSNILLKDGALSLSSILYAHKNLNAAQKLAFIVGNILFHRSQAVPNLINMLSVRFGSSEENAIDIFEYISLGAPMADLLGPIDKFQESPDTWIELVEMKSKISATGLDASVVGKPFPNILPFAAKNKEAGATAKIGYGHNGTQTVVNIFFSELFFTPGKPFTGKADIQVLVPEILPFLKQNVPNLFEWKNYDQNVSVGWPVMTIGDPHNPAISFDTFDQIFMDAPPLFLWTPLTFVPKLVNPFKNGLGLDIDVHVPNPGPLFADFGFLTTRMYHKGKEVAIVTNPRAVIIKNKMNGGELFGTNIITLQVRIHLSRNPFKAWEELSDMIHNFQDYTVDIESSTPELGRVEWLTTCFNHVPDYMTGQMIPMLLSMLSHIKLKVGPWTITPPEHFRRGAQMMLNKLDQDHVKFIGSEAEVDSDHFMAQGHISGVNGVHNESQFDDRKDNTENDDEVHSWNEIASNILEQEDEIRGSRQELNEISLSGDSLVKVH